MENKTISQKRTILDLVVSAGSKKVCYYSTFNSLTVFSPPRDLPPVQWETRDR